VALFPSVLEYSAQTGWPL